MGEAKRRGPVPEAERQGKPARWLLGALTKFGLSPDKLHQARRAKRARLTKKEKARIKRQYRYEHGLSRRQADAMGAGHLPWPTDEDGEG